MRNILLALLAATSIATAADNFLDGISISPVGAYKQAGFTHGPSEYGAGVDLGLTIKPWWSLHVRNLAFEGPGQSSHEVKTPKSFETVTTGEQPWGGSAIDETTLYAKANFITYEKLVLFGTGGGSRHWSSDDWSFGLGVGAEYQFTKHFSASVSREIRAYTKGTKDWLSTAAFNLTF